MGIFDFIRHKKEEETSDTSSFDYGQNNVDEQNTISSDTELQTEDTVSDFRPSFRDERPTYPFKQEQNITSDKDIQLILAKLEIINQKLENIDRRLQDIERLAKE